MAGRLLWDERNIERLRQHVATGGSLMRASVIFRIGTTQLRAKARELGCPFPTEREDRARRAAAMARTNQIATD
jgi:hypothetical protein